MSCELEKGGECFGCADNLRMQIKDAGGHARIGDRLSRMVSEMMAAQGEILGLEAQLVAAEDAKIGAQSALSKEKLKSEELQRQLEDMEKEVLEKDAVVERLKLEFGQTKELNISCEKIASETIAELKKMKQEVELQESKNWDLCRYISLLETELKQLMGEGGKARDEAGKMKAELEQIRSEAAHSKDRVLEAQVENALLKVELHKWRSKAAAAEAAEERSKSQKLALNRALQLAASSQHKQTPQSDTNISRKEYDNKEDHQVMERELMTATRKIREFRTRAEQAISRAEAAEKAKAELEEKIKRRKEEEKKKKDFFEKLRKEINSREAASPDFEAKNTPAIQTLSNVLEIPL